MKTEKETEIKRQDGFTDLCKRIGERYNAKESYDAKIADDLTLSMMYMSNGMTTVITDLLANDMMREGFEVIGDSDGIIIDYMSNLYADREITQALTWNFLFGGSVIFMVINDGQTADQPVDINNIQSIEKLKVYDRTQVSVFNYYTDPNKANFGEPEYFTLNTDDIVSYKIHESRMLIFKGKALPYQMKGQIGYDKFWGMSIIQPIFETIKNYDLAFQGIMDMLKKANMQVLKITDIINLLSSDEGRESLYNRLYTMDKALSINNTTVIDKEEEFSLVSQSFTGIADVMAKGESKISAETKIPVTILYGTSPKGLNATGDNEVRIYYDSIKTKQTFILQPEIKKMITYITAIKDLGLKKATEYQIDFNPLWQMTDDEIVKMTKTQAETDQIYINLGVLDPEEVRKSRFGGDNYSIETEIEGDAPKKVEQPESKEEKLANGI